MKAHDADRGVDVRPVGALVECGGTTFDLAGQLGTLANQAQTQHSCHQGPFWAALPSDRRDS